MMSDPEQPKPRRASPGLPKAGLPKADLTKVGDTRAIVTWVAANLAVSPAKVDLKSAPNSIAVGLLNWARDEPGDFWKIWARLLPTKQQVERLGRFEDDGRKLIKILDDLDDASDGGHERDQVTGQWDNKTALRRAAEAEAKASKARNAAELAKTDDDLLGPAKHHDEIRRQMAEERARGREAAARKEAGDA